MDVKQLKKTLTRKRTPLIAGIGALLLIIAFVVITSSGPTRSAASFCSTYKQEDARLSKSYGDTYSVHPFTHSSNNPHDFVVALGDLDAVAPKEIEPDVKTLKLIFKKIDNDPSQALSASLSGLNAESDVAGWTAQHCQ